MRKLLSVAGILLFVAVVWAAGPAKVVAAFRGAHALPFAAAFAFSAAMLATKSVRWWLLLSASGFDTSLVKVARRFLVGNFLGLATPGRVGDFAKALYFSGAGKGAVARALATTVIDRILDIATLILLGAAVLLHRSGATLALPLVAIGMFFALLAAKRRFGAAFLRRVFRKLTPASHRDRVDEEFAIFYGQVSALLTRRILWLPAALAGLAYAFLMAGVIALSRALAIDAPPAFVAASGVLAIYAALLPISVGGLGSREAVLIACFAQRGLPAERAVALSLAFFAVFYLAPAAAGALVWQRDPVSLPRGMGRGRDAAKVGPS